MRAPARALIPLALLLLVGGGSAPAPAPSHELDTFVTTQMTQRRINGLSLAIVQDGKIVAVRAYGITDRGQARRVDSTTLFQAGSISKSVAALGALRLVERGALDLDGDVNRTLASWRVPPSAHTASTPVTLRGLLSHTAGLTVHGFPGYDADSAQPTLVQVLDGARPTNTAPIRNDTIPGARWKYSGGGYTVMQQMVIDATKQPFPEVMRREVLAPLGMGRSSFEQPLPRALAANTAAGHDNTGSPVHGRWHVYPEMAAAGLWTTPSDLARFAIGVQRSVTGEPGAVLSPAMAKQMITERMNGYGLGVGVQGSGRALRFSHNGRDKGFDAAMMATAETGQAYVVMINANDNSGFMRRIGTFIERAYGWPGVSAYRPPAEASGVGPAELESAAGLYELGNGAFAVMVPRARRLFGMADGALDEEFIPLGNDRYASADRDFRLEIVRDASGAAVAMRRVTPAGARTVPRLGPLFRTVRGGVIDPAAQARADSVLRALSVGGEAVRAAGGLSAGARTDFGAMRWPPVVGLGRIAFAGAVDVAGDVSRHGSPVARLAYYRVGTAAGERLIIVYFTKDGLVTDVDVIDE